MARTSEKQHDDNPFTQCGPYGTLVEPPRLATPVMRSIEQVVQSPPQITDLGKVMRRVPDRIPGMLVIEANDAGLKCLHSMLGRPDLTCVFVNLKNEPDIAEATQFIATALQCFGQAKPNLPRPIYVGLHGVVPERRDAVQRGLVMKGVGGFERDTAEAFARRFGASLITAPCTGHDDHVTKQRVIKTTKNTFGGKALARRVDTSEQSRRR